MSPPTTWMLSRSTGWSNTCKNFPGTVIAVTHDRYFLDNVAGWILELDRGEGIPWKGNYSSWLEQKAKRLEQEEKPRASAAKPWSGNWSGFVWRPRHASPKGKRV
jgi:sulfate-transporting ATPase